MFGEQADRYLYIPLCFYLIKGFRADWEATRCLYIPLCFYLIAAQYRPSKMIVKTLHSTMLLLNPHGFDGVPATEFSLHSTMLLLNPDREYICDCGYHTLHSTMLLLNPLSVTFVHQPTPPLHSTMLLLNHGHEIGQQRLFRLYIPLCFYLILNGKKQERDCTSFTFHYAST